MSDVNNGSEFDVKRDRLENPTGWMYLSRYESVRLIIDALLEAQPGYKFNKSELARRSGASRESIRNRLPRLLDLGIVNVLDENGWPEYELNDKSRIVKELIELNNAVNSVRAGQSPDLRKINFNLKGTISSFHNPENFKGAAVEGYRVKDYTEMSKVASDQAYDDFEPIKTKITS